MRGRSGPKANLTGAGGLNFAAAVKNKLFAGAGRSGTDTLRN